MPSFSLTRTIFFFLAILLLLSTATFHVSTATPQIGVHIPSSLESSTFEMERHATRTKLQNRAARYRIAVQRQSQSQEQIPVWSHVVSIAAKDEIKHIKTKGEKTMITTKTKTQMTHTPTATVAVKPNPQIHGNTSDLVKKVGDLKKAAQKVNEGVKNISSAAKNLLELQKEVKNQMALHTAAMNAHLGSLNGMIRYIEEAVNEPSLKNQLASMSSILSASHSSSRGAQDGNGGKQESKIAENIARLMQLLLANAESMTGLERKIMKIFGLVEVINSELTSLNEYLVEVGLKIEILINV